MACLALSGRVGCARFAGDHNGPRDSNRGVPVHRGASPSPHQRGPFFSRRPAARDLCPPDRDHYDIDLFRAPAAQRYPDSRPRGGVRRPPPRAPARHRRRRLHHADADPRAEHRPPPGRPRPPRQRPDRHRQDRGLHPAAPPAPRRQQQAAGTRRPAGADPRPDPRARGPDRRQHQDLRPLPPAQPHRDLRRGQPVPPGQGPRPRRRHPRRHPRAPPRPDAAGLHQPGRGRGLHPRRGRPDARHGLHPRHQAGAREDPGQASDPLLLGDDGPEDGRARELDGPRSYPGDDHPGSARGRADRPEGALPRQARQGHRPRQHPQGVGPQQGDHLHADEVRRQPGRRQAPGGRHLLRGDPRQQEPGCAYPGARRLQAGSLSGPRRHRRRRPRPRRRRHHPRDQLRPADGGRDLCA